MKNMLKGLVPKPFRQILRKAVNALTPTETIDKSKEKWNSLADKNARYYVLTDYGEKISEKKFKETGKVDFENHVLNDKLLKEKLSPFRDKSVLEIGCGIGRITEFFAEHFHDVVGVDISESMIAQGKERLSNHKNVILIAGDGKTIPLRDTSKDFVFSFIVFQHMPDKETVRANLSEIGRILKKGGIAKIQLRGVPTSKKNWFYGPAFTDKDIPELLRGTRLKVLKTEGLGTRYFWVWLEKNE